MLHAKATKNKSLHITMYLPYLTYDGLLSSLFPTRCFLQPPTLPIEAETPTSTVIELRMHGQIVVPGL